MATKLPYQLGKDSPRTLHESWYRGEVCNFIGSKKNLKEKDAITNYILHGWTPAEPFITKEHVITAFGSCFARHVSIYLQEQGYQIPMNVGVHDAAYIVRCGAGINNTFAVRQQFEWAFEGRTFREDLWYDEEKGLNKPLKEVQEVTRTIFDRTDVLIMTLGLAEIWYNRVTGEVFWRAIPKSRFDPVVHGFRVSTVEENRENLEKVYALIRKHRPDASIIFTLSPVPLVATFRPVSCATANSVSKAILRVAVDELMRRHEDDPDLFYYPSYEIVKDFFRDAYEEDNRHIKSKVLKEVMQHFARFYLKDG